MIRGDNYQVVTGLIPSLLLRLMAEDEDVNVKHPGQFIKRGLTVFSSPR